MRERKPLRSQVDSLSFTLTENGHALYRSDIMCVRSKMIFSPEFNVAISVGMHQQKPKLAHMPTKCKSVFTQHNSINLPENKTLYFICILCVFVMYIFILIF